MPAAHRFGNAVELEGDLGDDGERALRAHQQPGEVVARGRFARPARGGEHLAIAEHRFERQHVVLHGAVAHRIGAGGPGRRHAADRGVGAGIDREEHALVAQILVELLAGDARLDHAVEVFRMDRQHPVHVAQIDADAAIGGVDLALQRGAGAERDDRHPMGGADAHDRLHLRRRARKHHGIGRLARQPGGGVAMLLAHREPGREARAEHVAERRQRRCGSRLAGAPSSRAPAPSSAGPRRVGDGADRRAKKAFRRDWRRCRFGETGSKFLA